MKKTLIIALLLATISLGLALDFRYITLLLIPAVIIFLPKSIFDRRYMFFFILSIFAILPQLERYSVLPVITSSMASVILLIMLFYSCNNIRLSNSYNIFFLILIALIAFQTFRGYFLGYKFYYLFSEAIKYLYYPIGFFFTMSMFKDDDKDESIIKNFLLFFLVSGIIISIQILFYHFNVTRGERVLTRQANLLLMSIVVAIIYFFAYARDIKEKIMISILLMLYILSVILFMQRSLWGGIIVALLSLMFCLQKKIIKSNKEAIIIVLIIALLLAVVINIYQSINFNSDVMSTRTDVLESGTKSFSLGVRLLSFARIFQKIKNHPIIGSGFGDSLVTPYLNSREVGFVDNSFIVILWKSGILGFMIFCVIFIRFFFQLFKIINHSKNKHYILFAIFSLSTIVGQMVNGLACVIMILYHFNIYWAAIIAITDYIYRREFYTQNEKTH